ncbi:MORC family CW-type zinc finger protein 3 [Silurus asotus]|uniref:MORC family CW-type zinc finger protein 3 n=1 Tax=Silurus asotus TaxID=30991 RepID=A0AAD5FML7_SILAS|nr:MORC family CW-type zinc finger protein 3 [Silurus asotus]
MGVARPLDFAVGIARSLDSTVGVAQLLISAKGHRPVNTSDTTGLQPLRSGANYESASLISPRYLHTISTIHPGLFSAVAQLIDNAYDPDVSAQHFWIDKTEFKGQDCLIFMDNGKGMDYDTMHQMLSFGFSDKQTLEDHAPVGLYGNGFKSGSMRLGKDVIVFSKKANTITSSGELQFDFIKDRYDFQIRGNVCKSSIKTNKTQPEDRMSVPKSNYSLRAYCSILYLKPKMQIILQKRKVETCVVSKTLSKVFSILSHQQPIPITFGYNTKTKDHCGLMMYHKNRLIKAYEHVACQRKGGRIGLGVIGVIECNYLTPTLNKQDFDNTKIYRKTMLSVGNKLEKYWKDVKYRYKYCDKPDEDIGRQPDSNWVQCNDCVKWRKLPDGTESSELNKKWFCYMNPDPKFRSCEAKEESEDSENELYYHKIYNKQEKRTAPDLLQENPEKKARVGDYSISDGPTTSTASPYLFPFIPITCFDSIEEDWEKANETEPTASGNDVTDKNSVNKEQINQMTQTSSENKHDYQELYLQVKEEIKQIQHILEEKAKEQEELKGKVEPKTP